MKLKSAELQSLLGIILILIIGRMVFLTEPYGVSVDESTYLAVAEAWDHYGTPYVDGVDRKPPLLYGLYWLTGKVFGFFNIHGVHLVFFLWALGTCLLGAAFARKLWPRLNFWFAATVLALVSATFPREFISSNGEIASVPFLFLAGWALLKSFEEERGGRIWGWAFAAGFIIAMGALMKQVIVVPFLLMSLFVAARELRRASAVLVAGALGAIIFFGLVYGFFVWKNAVDDFILWNFKDNFAYVQDGNRLESFGRPIWSSLGLSLLAWPIYWLGFGKRFFKPLKDVSREDLAAFGMVLGGWLLIPLSGRLFAHYFVPLGFVLAVAAAGPLQNYMVHPKWRRLVVLGLMLPFTVCVLVSTYREEVQSYFTKPPTFDRATQAKLVEVAGRIHRETQEGDRIVVWGMASQLYVLSGRGSGTRFIPADYVSGRMGGFSKATRHSFVERNLGMYLKDFETKKPALIVDTNEAALNDYQYFPMKDYPALWTYVQENYIYLGREAGIGLWKRKP